MKWVAQFFIVELVSKVFRFLFFNFLLFIDDERNSIVPHLFLHTTESSSRHETLKKMYLKSCRNVNKIKFFPCGIPI